MALDEKNVYALDAGKNSFLTMTREQILAAITQAVSTGEIKDIDAGFITKLQEMNKQGVLQLWVGTMAEFEALEEKNDNMLYLFTDDPTVTDIEGELKNLETQIKNIVEGNTVVKKAEAAETAGKATQDGNGKVISDTYLKQGQRVLAIDNMNPNAWDSGSSTYDLKSKGAGIYMIALTDYPDNIGFLVYSGSGCASTIIHVTDINDIGKADVRQITIGYNGTKWYARLITFINSSGQIQITDGTLNFHTFKIKKLLEL